MLELACGSGRLLVPLAQAGHRVVGVDSSEHMLDLAKGKLRFAGGQTSIRSELVLADMTSFALEERFDLAIIAVNSFCYLTERVRQQTTLRAIFAHLRPGGLLAIALLNPSPAWLARADGALDQDLLQETEGGVAMRTETVVSTDLAAQIRVIRSVYDLVDEHGDVRRRLVEWPLRFVYRFEAELLLESAGFTVEAVLGGYDRERFSSSSKVLMLLARVPPAA